MKVNELLLEKTLIKQKWEVSKLTLESAINLLNEHCKDSLTDIANGSILWRGMGEVGKIAMLDSTEAYRTSKDTNNLYQLAMESSSQMVGVPPRSRSFICTNNSSTAYGYGSELYAVFPYDGTTIAKINRDDIFSLYVSALDVSIQDFCEHLEEVFSVFSIKPDTGSKFTNAKMLDDKLTGIDAGIILYEMIIEMGIKTSSDMLKRVIDYYNKRTPMPIENTYSPVKMYRAGELDIVLFSKSLLAQIADYPVVAKLYKAMAKNPNKKFTALSSVVMSPKDLSITLTKPGSIKSGDTEHWFSGKCVALQSKVFFSIVLEMKKRNMRVSKELVDLAIEYS